MRAGTRRSGDRPFVVIGAGTPHTEDTMKYLLLLYGDAAAEAAMGPDARGAMVEDHRRFSALMRERGAIVLGEALEGPEQTRTVRFDGGDRPVVTDGPFLEAKEALGGLYVLECASLDDAIELAKQVPRSPGLVVQVSPIAAT
jgi:hypothetical protein